MSKQAFYVVWVLAMVVIYSLLIGYYSPASGGGFFVLSHL